MMIKLKLKLKRVVSCVLAFAMLFSMLTFSEFSKLEAKAAVSNTHVSYPVTFYVPEAIYLKASSGSATQFEFFIDCSTDGSTLTANRSDTSGSVYFYCSGATSVSISTNASSISLGTTSGTNTINTNVTGGSLSTGVAAGSAGTLTWTATYTVGGDTRIAKAYSACYAPFYEPIASAIKFHNDDGWGTGNRAYLQSATWLSGIHSYSPSKPWKCNLTSGNRIAPLLGVVTPPGGAEVSNWFTNSSGGSNYTSKESGKNDYLIVLNSATGSLTIDSSRYTNYDQIPNLSIGMMLTDTTSNDDWVKGYISDYTGQTLNLTDITSDSESTMKNCYNTKGSLVTDEFNLSRSAALGVRFDRSFGSRAITRNRTGSEKYILKGCVYGANDGEDIVNCMLCPVNVTFVNKTSLRNKVRQYVNLGLQSADYTVKSYASFINALSDAATRLGNPASSNTSYSALDTAYNDLSEQTYTATIKHRLPCTAGATGLVNGSSRADSADGSTDGYITLTETLTFNAGDTVNFSTNSYTGYTVSSASGHTTSTAAQSVANRRSNISQTYTYAARSYTVTLNYGSDSAGGYGHQKYTSSYNTSTISVKYNHTYASQGLPSPTMAGWQFNGWYSNSGLTTALPSVMTQTANHTVYAKWTCYFGGGHGYRTGQAVNGSTMTYDDMFLISSNTYLDRIDANDNNYSYTNSSSNRYSYKQTTDLIWNNSTKTPVTSFYGYYQGDNKTLTLAAGTMINDYYYHGIFNHSDGATFEQLNGVISGTLNATETTAENPNYLGFFGYSVHSTFNKVHITLDSTGAISGYSHNTASDPSMGRTGVFAGLLTHVTCTNCTVTIEGGTLTDKSTRTGVDQSRKYLKYFAGQILSPTNTTSDFTNCWTLIKNKPTGTVNEARQYNGIGYMYLRDGENSSGVTDGTVNIDKSGVSEGADGNEQIFKFTAQPSSGFSTQYRTGKTLNDINHTVTTGLSGSGNVSFTQNKLTYQYGTGSTEYMFNADGSTTPGGTPPTWYSVWFVRPLTLSVDTVVAGTTNPGSTAGGIIKYGSTNVSTKTYYLTRGQTLSFTSNANTGYRFTTWAASGGSSSASTTSPTTYTMGGSNATLKATFTANSYTVVYNANGGTGSIASSTHYWSQAKNLTSNNNNITRTGYTFNGWNTAANGSGTSYTNGQSVSNLTSVNGGTVTLYAKWTINSYKLTFNLNNVTGKEQAQGTTPAQQTKEYNSTVTLPTSSTGTFYKTGYTFKGWSTNSSSTTGSSTYVVPASNSTLYAIWQANTYTVTWNTNGGSANTQNSATYDSTYTIPSAPTKTGYTFAGWFTAASGGTQITSSTVVKITAAKTYYAHWTPKTYTVTWNANGGTPGTATTTATYDASYVLPTAPTRTGYTFAGWFTAASGGSQITGSTTVKITAATTYYAHWTPKTYTVTWNANGGTPGTATTTATYDASYVLPTAPTRTGYTFAGWFTAASGGTQITGSTTVKITAATTYYAHWTANTYTVNYNANGGSGTTAQSTHTYDTAKNLTKNGFSRSGYTFLGWSLSSTATTQTYTDEQSVTNLAPSGSVTLYAVWSENSYDLTFSGNGGSVYINSTLVSSGSISYEYTALLNALGNTTLPERTGYIFAGYKHATSEFTKNLFNGKWLNQTVNTTNGTFSDNASADRTDYIPVTAGVTYTISNYAGSTNNWILYNSSKSFVSNAKTNDTTYTASQTGYIIVAFNNGLNDAYRSKFIFEEKKASTTYASAFGANDATLTAQWEAITYEVTYDGNGSTSGTTGATTHTYGTASSLATNGFNKTGYHFVSWNTSSSGGAGTRVSQANNLTTVASGSFKVYAEWAANTYTVNFEGNHGTITDAIQEGTTAVTFTYNASGNTMAGEVYIRTGYTLIGWEPNSADALSKTATMIGGGTATPTYAINAVLSSTNNLSTENNATVNMYAVWQPKTVSVTWNAEPGSPTSHTTVIYDSYYTLPSAPTRTGYLFAGWYTATSGGTKITSSTQVKLTSARTYYAHWTPITYTVTYNINTGTTGTTAQSTHTYDQPKNLTSNGYSKTGYTFNGWNTAANGSGTNYSNTQSVSNLTSVNEGNVTLYAQWKINQYKITFIENSGTIVSDITQNYATTYVMPETTRTGYTFGGWYDNAQFTGTSYAAGTTMSVGASDKTYYAKWTAKTFTVTWNNNDGTTDKTTTTVTYDSNYVLPTQPSRTGYTFQGWYTSASSGTQITGSTVVKITQNTDFYAHWTPKTYAVEWDAGEGSPDGSTTVTYDATYVLPTAPTRTGYTFAGWYTQASGGTQITGSTEVKITDATTYYAHWTPKTYTVTWNNNDGTTDKTTTTVTYDSNYVLPTQPSRTGYTFQGWYTATSGGTQITGSTVVKITSATTYYAHWTANSYTVVYHPNAGIGSIANTTHYYAQAKNLAENGGQITRVGYTFTGWSENSDASTATYSDGANVINLESSPNGTVVLYAVWSVNSYLLTFDASPGTVYVNSSRQTSDTKSYSYTGMLDALGLTAQPQNTGYLFTGWSNGENIVSFNLFDGIWENGYVDDEGNTVPSPMYPNSVGTAWIYTSPGTTYDISGHGGTSNTWFGLDENGATVTLGTNLSSLTLTDETVYMIKVVFQSGLSDSYRTGFILEESLSQTTYGSVFGADTATLNAQWSPITYYVSYDGNGSTGGTTNMTTHTYDTTSALATNGYSKTGYHFISWNQSPSGGASTRLTQVSTLTNVSGATVTIYAEWAPNTYTVEYDINTLENGSGTTASSSHVYNQQKSLTSNGYNKTGYHFVSWNTAANGSGTSYTNGQSVSNLTNVNAGTVTLYAQWAANTYTVLYNANGGSGTTASSSHVYDEEKNLTTNGFSRTGYDFTGWNTAANGSGTSYTNGQSVSNLTNVNAGTVTLYAQWDAKTYNVTWDAAGGTPATQSGTVTYNDAYTAPNEPTKEGYDFAGWFTESGGNGTQIKFGAGEQTIYNPASPGDHTLYAKWSVNQYTVRFVTNGGNSINDITQNYGTSFIFPATTRTGYTFFAWYENTALTQGEHKVGTQGTITAQTKYYYAKWIAHTYTIQYNGNGATSGATQSTTHTYDIPKALSENGYVRTGHTFLGWNTIADGTGESFAPNAIIDENLTDTNGEIIILYAQWSAVGYKVQYNANGGTGTMQDSNHVYGVLTPLRANTFEKVGYLFAKWNTSADGSGTDYSDIQPVLDLTDEDGATVKLYAQWTPITYYVGYNNNTGSGTMSPTSHTYDAGKALSENTLTKDGYTFAGWNTVADGSGTGYDDEEEVINLTTTHLATVTLYAQWDANTYSVRYNGNGSTGGTMSDSSHTYDTPKALTKNAFEKTGYTFLGWNTAADGSATSYDDEEEVMNLTAVNGGIFNLYAQWEVNTYELTFYANGGKVQETEDSTKKNYTYTSTLGALASQVNPLRTGHIFKGWYIEETAVSENLFDGSYIKGTVGSTGTVGVSATAITTNQIPVTAGKVYTLSGSGSTSNEWHFYSNTDTYVGMQQANTQQYTATASGYLRIEFPAGIYGSLRTGVVLEESLSAAYGTVFTDENGELTAQWEPITYFVSYNGNGSTGGSTAVTEHKYMEESALAVNGYTKTGYHWTNWSTHASGGTEVTQAYNLTSVSYETVTLYAVWEPDTYTVTWNANGGTPETATTTATYDSTYTLPSNPVRTGYTFGGWYTQASGGTQITSSTVVKITQDTTYYARWTANTYTVTWDANGGSPDGSTTATYDSTYTLPSNPVRTGYTFGGWYTQASGGTQITGSTTVKITQDTTYYAHWTANTYTVTWDAEGGTPESQQNSVTYMGTYTAPTEATRTGYTFGGWYTQPNGNGEQINTGVENPTIYNPASPGNHTLYAKWSVNQYTVSFVTYDGHYINDITQSYGTTFSFPGVSRTGYAFCGWYDNAGFTGTSYSANDIGTIGAQNITYYAKWSKESYTIRFSASGGEFSDGLTVKEITASYGDTIGLVEQPTRAGYNFSRWNDSEGATFTVPATMPDYGADGTIIEVSTYWSAKLITITFDSNGGTPVTEIVAYYPSPVTAPTPPTKTGFSFVEWRLNGEEYDFTVNDIMPVQDITLVAYWEISSFTLSYNTGYGTTASTGYDTSGTTISQQSVEYNTSVTLSSGSGLICDDSSREVYRTFLGWSTVSSATAVQYEPGESITMPPQNVTLYAVWSSNYYELNTLIATYIDGDTLVPELPASINEPENYQGNMYAKEYYTVATTDNLKTTILAAGNEEYKNLPQAQQATVDGLCLNITSAVEGLVLRPIDYTLSYDCPIGEMGDLPHESCDGAHSYEEIKELCLDIINNNQIGEYEIYSNVEDLSYMLETSEIELEECTKAPDQGMVEIWVYTLAETYHFLTPNSAHTEELEDEMINKYQQNSGDYTATYYTNETISPYLDYIQNVATPAIVEKGGYSGFTIFDQLDIDEYASTLKERREALVPLIADEYRDYVLVAINRLRSSSSYGNYAGYNGPSIDEYTHAVTYETLGAQMLESLSSYYTDTSLQNLRSAINSVNWSYTELQAKPNSQNSNAIIGYASAIQEAISSLERKSITCNINHCLQSVSDDTVYEIASSGSINVNLYETYDLNTWATSFEGFYLREDDNTATITITSSVTINLHYNRYEYSISYETNGGTSASPMDVKFGTTAQLPIPEKTGYTFIGWYMNSTLTTEVNLTNPIKNTTDGNNVNGVTTYTREGTVPNWGTDGLEVTLYAKWAANTNTPYTIKYYLQNLDGTYPQTETDTKQMTGTTGTVVTYSEEVILGFNYNSEASDAVTSGTIEADGSTVLKVYYDRRQYAVTFSSNGGQLTDDGQQMVLYGGTVTQPSDPVYENYDFTGWYTESGAVNRFDFSTVVTGAMTLYAGWKEKPADYTELEELFEECGEIYGIENPDVPVLDENGVEKNSINLYTNASYSSYTNAMDAASLALEDKNMPLSQQSVVDALKQALENAIENLVYAPADYTYVENMEQLAAETDTNINHIAYLGETTPEELVADLNEKLDTVEKGKNASAQSVVNGYASEIKVAISNIKPYYDTVKPKLSVYEVGEDVEEYAQGKSELQAELAEKNYGKIGYVFPGKGYYTYYCYTNSENPVILIDVKDIADANGRVSYPAHIDVTSSVSDAQKAQASKSEIIGSQASSAPATQSSDRYSCMLLTPQFTKGYNDKQYAIYTIKVSDDALDMNEPDTMSLEGGMESARDCSYGTTLNEDVTPAGYVTIYVEYRNSMSQDNEGNYVDDGRDPMSLRAYTNLEPQYSTDTQWAYRGVLGRTGGGIDSVWNYAKMNDTVYVFNDPNYEQKNLGSFYYYLNETNDSAIINKFLSGDKAGATSDMINAINSNYETYQGSLAAWGQSSWSVFYQEQGDIDRNVAYVHLVDRWGNVFNGLIKLVNIDKDAPTIALGESASETTVTESGRSGIKDIKVYEYAYEGSTVTLAGGRFALKAACDQQWISDTMLNSGSNVLRIKPEGAEGTGRYTLLVTDKAGNSRTKTVYTDEQGYLNITIIDEFNNVVDGGIMQSLVTGDIYTFALNEQYTVNINAPLSSVIEITAPEDAAINSTAIINVMVEQGVDMLKVEDISTGAAQTYLPTSEGVTITENGDGTATWSIGVYLTKLEGIYRVTARAYTVWEDAGFERRITCTSQAQVEPLISAQGQQVNVGETAYVTVITSAEVDRVRLTNQSNSTKTYTKTNSTVTITQNEDGTLTWLIPYRLGKPGEFTLTVTARVGSAWELTSLTATVVYV